MMLFLRIVEHIFDICPQVVRRRGSEASVNRKMGQATRTTKLLLEFGARAEGGANTAKRAYLEEAARLLDRARAFYVAFFLAHPDKLAERVRYFSEHHQE